MFSHMPLGITAAESAAAAQWTSVVVLAVTGVYIALQVRETRRMRFAQSRPYVVPAFHFRSVLASIRVANTGSTPARNVRLWFVGDTPTSNVGTLDWVGKGLWGSTGMAVLPPGHHLDFHLDSVPKRVESGDPLSWTVCVQYEDATGRLLPAETYELDLTPYLQASARKSDLHSISDTLEKIRKNTDRWTDARRGLMVSVEDRDRAAAREYRPYRIRKGRQAYQDHGIRGLVAHLWGWFRDRYGLWSR